MGRLPYEGHSDVATSWKLRERPGTELSWRLRRERGPVDTLVCAFQLSELWTAAYPLF